MANIKLEYVEGYEVAPGDTYSGYSRASVVGFSENDMVIVSANPTKKEANFEIVAQGRAFADDNGESTIWYSVKNTGTVADTPTFPHLIVSRS